MNENENGSAKDADLADAWAEAMAESGEETADDAGAPDKEWKRPEPPAHQLVTENPAAEALEQEIEELRAVVHQTEDAAVRILSYVESVSLAVEALAPEGGGPGRTAARGARDGLMQIAEACSFQDLTGQRLEAVARRLEMVIEGELRPRDISSEEAGLAQTGAADPELDQAAIDALFD